MNLVDLSNDYIFGLFLVFCRIAGIVMLMPILGEKSVISIARIFISGLFAMMFFPMIKLPSFTNTALDLITIGSEVIVGIFFGLSIRLMLSGIQEVGTIITSQSGLAMASIFDPSENSQNPVIGVMFNMIIIMMFIAMQIDHELIKCMLLSYKKIAAGEFFSHIDFCIKALTDIAVLSLSIALRLSMPFIIVNLLIMLVSGVLSRVMPGLQIFFILVPMQVAAFILLLVVTMFYIINSFIDEFRSFLESFF